MGTTNYVLFSGAVLAAFILGILITLFVAPKMEFGGWHHLLTKLDERGSPVLYVDGKPAIGIVGKAYKATGMWLHFRPDAHSQNGFIADVELKEEDVKKICEQGLGTKKL